MTPAKAAAPASIPTDQRRRATSADDQKRRITQAPVRAHPPLVDFTANLNSDGLRAGLIYDQRPRSSDVSSWVEYEFRQ